MCVEQWKAGKGPGYEQSGKLGCCTSHKDDIRINGADSGGGWWVRDW